MGGGHNPTRGPNKSRSQDTCKSPQMFRVISIAHRGKLENLYIILSFVNILFHILHITEN